jgi:tRNA modification GTPase
MINKLSGWDDTIVALATAPGIAAIGVIRLSGTEAISIADQLFPSKDLKKVDTHTIHVGILSDEGKAIDEVVVSVFKGPKSYTGENVVEISSHGSPFVQQQVIEACMRHGARLARAGEFTQRAFLKGKLDLTQAEAVADMIAANSERSGRAALQKIRGGFANELSALREQLIQFAGLIELELDFAEEDVAFADRARFYALLTTIAQTVDRLIESFRLGNVIKNGVSVAIIGKPNAGKSTLLNALLKEERAIVSDIAGTTRDTIEELLNIDGIVFRLIDTAGIRDHTTDRIEHLGIGRSLEKMQQADIILYIFDGNENSKEEIAAQVKQFEDTGKKYVLICNKTDQQTTSFYDDRFSDLHSLLLISAKDGKGVEELKTLLFKQAVEDESMEDQTIVTSARHVEQLRKLKSAVHSIQNGLDNQLSGDLIAPDIRQALYHLGEITGEITNEDTLDYIFSKFCIGK